MSKVIVERPRMRFPLRAGSAYPRAHQSSPWRRRPEDAPCHEPMGGPYAEKRLNENLRPLVRFLRSSVGRPWDKVYAEISERISLRSAVQKHILQHLFDFVAVNVELRGKEVWAREGWRGARAIQSRGSWFRFYVDPRSRLLRLAPPAPPRAREEADRDHIALTADTHLQRIDGIWYAIVTKPIPADPIERARTFDVVDRVRLDGRHRAASTHPLWRRGRYAAHKSQLGKRELARHGLHEPSRAR